MVIGTVAIDSVETPFGKQEQVFGGSASYFSYAASFFVPVNLVAVVGADFPDSYRAILKERPIGLEHLVALPGKTFHWKGKYEGDLNSAQTLATELNVLTEFRPMLGPADEPKLLFLANIDPELQLDVLNQVKRPKCRFVACDTMNYWIGTKLPVLRTVLSRINMLVINDGEARLLTGSGSLIRSARKIQSMGPDIVIVKKGEHGAILVHGEQIFVLPAYPLEEVFDPTGAGDTFAGGVMGHLAKTMDFSFENVKTAMVQGAVIASFTVERFGLERLRELGTREIEERISLFRKICKF